MREWWRRFRIGKGWLIMYRIKKPFRAIGEFLLKHFSIYRVALIFALLGGWIWYQTKVSIEELWPNIIPELFSIAITVFILDTINQKRSDDELKKVLIRKMGSKNNDVATEAWTEINARGWSYDSTLERAFLLSANLDGNRFTGANMRGIVLSGASLKETSWLEANLEDANLLDADMSNSTFFSPMDGPHIAQANLRNAYLNKVNLSGAKIRYEQLVQARSLLGATMPDGQTYDGRYRLPGDVEFIENVFARSGIPFGPKEIASLYGVTVAQYQIGQVWADDHKYLFTERNKKPEHDEKRQKRNRAAIITVGLILAFLLGTVDWKAIFESLGF